MKNEALKLLKSGFSIIPIDTKTKKPLIAWEGFQKAPATTHEVEGWFKQWPNAGVGVVTGKVSGCVVFDIDPRHKGDQKLFEKYQTVISQTGGGGWHYFFKYPDSVVQNAVGVLPGVDIRGKGGYVIVPPSLHPSGKQYTWVKSPFETKMLKLPQELKTKLEEKKTKETTFDPEVLKGVPEGQRNESAASVIGKTIKGLKRGDFDKVAWPLVKGWNKENDPPLPLDELRRTFLSICEAELRARSGKMGIEDLRAKTETVENFLKTPPKIEPMVINQLIPQGCSFLSGLPKHYKSYLSLHLADCLANGGRLFGKFEVRQQKVLICDRENPPSLVYKRLRQLSIKPSKNLILSFDRTPMNKKGFEESFLELLESLKIEFLVLDSFRRTFRGDENSSKEVSAFFEFIDKIKDLGVNILILHHHGKKPQFGVKDPQEVLRGSSDLAAYPDAHLTVKKQLIDGLIAVKVTPVYLRVDLPIDPFLVSVVNPDEDREKIKFDFKLFITRDEEKPQASRLDILELLQEKEQWWNRNEIYEALKNKGYGRILLNKTADRMAEDGQIDRKIGERGKVFYKVLSPENNLFS